MNSEQPNAVQLAGEAQDGSAGQTMIEYIEKEGVLIRLEPDGFPEIYRAGGQWEPYGDSSYLFGSPISEREAKQMMDLYDARKPA